jgi:formylglycine-generating enzyme required for sulfatase activity
MMRMARPRLLLPGLIVLLCLASCGREPGKALPARAQPARVPVATPAHAPSAARDTPAAPEAWRAQLPPLEPGQEEAMLRQADEALARAQLERGRSPGPGALELYLAVLAAQPQDARAQAGVQAVLEALFERGGIAMRAGRLEEAQRVLAIAEAAAPSHPDLPRYRALLQRAHSAQVELQLAERAGKAGELTTPEGNSVRDHLERARRAFPDFAPTATVQQRWNRVLLERAWKEAQREDFAAADSWLLESERLAPANTEARVQRLRIIELRQARSDALLAAGNAAVDALRLDAADAAHAHLQRIAAQPSVPKALAARIHLARHYGPFHPGQAFSEKLATGGRAPEMMVVAYGRFAMGAGDDDAEGLDSERPAHPVEFERGFAIARNETTVAEFGRFVAATRYRSTATRAGHSTVYDEKGGAFAEHEGVDWRRDHVGRPASPALPVVHVSFADATAYAAWLSKQTGRRYRLPSEAEFEYALRAGGRSAYPWGEGRPRRVVGNLAGDGDLSSVARHWGNAIGGYRDAFWGPAPVRNFAVEGFGTFDLIGNVSEWTLDCWHDSYQRAPADGSAWVNPGCPMRTVRGASWGSSLDQARSAARQSMDPATTTARLGFRVVREL